MNRGHRTERTATPRRAASIERQRARARYALQRTLTVSGLRLTAAGCPINFEAARSTSTNPSRTKGAAMPPPLGLILRAAIPDVRVPRARTTLLRRSAAPEAREA